MYFCCLILFSCGVLKKDVNEQPNCVLERHLGLRASGFRWSKGLRVFQDLGILGVMLCPRMTSFLFQNLHPFGSWGRQTMFLLWSLHQGDCQCKEAPVFIIFPSVGPVQPSIHGVYRSLHVSLRNSRTQKHLIYTWDRVEKNRHLQEVLGMLGLRSRPRAFVEEGYPSVL